MKVKNCRLAQVLLATVCLFSAVPTYAAGAITYDAGVSGGGCSTPNKYKALSASSAKALKITCPDATTPVDSLTIKYEPSASGLSWCGAYSKFVVTHDKTVTITCAPLFTIVPSTTSGSPTQVVAFTVTPTTLAASPLTLELTGAGLFTEMDGKTTAGTGNKLTVPFAANQAAQTIYARLTTAGSIATVTASAPGSAPITPVVVNVVDTGSCPKPENIYTEVPIDELPSKKDQYTVPRVSGGSNIWNIPANEAIAIKLKLPSTPPPAYSYIFTFSEATGITNGAKELVYHRCPGVFNTELGPYCQMEQVTGREGLTLYVSDKNTYKVCRGVPGQVYFLNIRDKAAGTKDDPSYPIRFLMSLIAS